MPIFGYQKQKNTNLLKESTSKIPFYLYFLSFESIVKIRIGLFLFRKSIPILAMKSIAKVPMIYFSKQNQHKTGIEIYR